MKKEHVNKNRIYFLSLLIFQFESFTKRLIKCDENEMK